MNTEPLCYYFGVKEAGGAGHYLYLPNGGQAGREVERSLPFSWKILDTMLLPQEGMAVEGIVHRIVFHGLKPWTVLSFWDRSGDSRPGSNSAFIMDFHAAFPLAVETARAAFPWVFKRFKFDLVPAGGK